MNPAVCEKLAIERRVGRSDRSSDENCLRSRSYLPPKMTKLARSDREFSRPRAVTEPRGAELPSPSLDGEAQRSELRLSHRRQGRCRTRALLSRGDILIRPITQQEVETARSGYQACHYFICSSSSVFTCVSRLKIHHSHDASESCFLCSSPHTLRNAWAPSTQSSVNGGTRNI